MQVSEITNLYREYANIPSPTSAVLLPDTKGNEVSVSSTWNSRDLARSELIKFTRHHTGLVKDSKICFVSCGLPQEVSSECMIASSKLGNKKAVLRKVIVKGEECQYLEIWNSTRKLKAFDVQCIEDHGKIYYDAQFGCLEWSKSEEFLLYVAEMKQPKKESFFKNIISNSDDANADSKKEKVQKGEEHLYQEDWGESLVGKHHPVICVMNINTGSVKILPMSEGVSPGQAVWAREDKAIVCIGWYEDPRRLGLHLCTIRRSSVFCIDLETEKYFGINNSKGSVRSPRFNSDGSILIYLENDVGGPHQRCSKLMKYDWKTKQEEIIIDIVQNPTENKFPGIYVEKLPKRCFAADDRHIIFSSPWRSKKELICVDVITKHLERLTTDDKIGSWTLLDVKDNFIVASASSPNIIPYLLVGQLQFGGTKTEIEWTCLDENSPSVLTGINWSIIPFKPREGNENVAYSDIDYEVLLLTPEPSRTPSPLIVWPHGGPHSVFSAGFQFHALLFSKLGYAVCMVNYRGSVGFGQNSIDSLLGNIGVQDVEDVQQAAESIMDREDIKSNAVGLYGGSHGGFLVTHLSGQYPDTYKLCVCRNPVIDISGKIEQTDIPDWNWVEAGYGDSFTFSSVPTPDMLKVMWEKSPIRYVNNVKIPTLILLGENDRRVPPSQGLKYYRNLKARNVPVRLYVYEDSHALSKVDVEADSFMQTALWLLKHFSY